jgi:hypothetical protein
LSVADLEGAVADLGVVDFVGAADFGVTDFGVTDFGVTDFGVTDFGATDFGATDFGATDFGVADFDVVDFNLAVDFVATGTPRRPAPLDAWVAPRWLAAKDGFRVFFVLDL